MTSDSFIDCECGHRKLSNVIEKASKVELKLSNSAINCDRVFSWISDVVHGCFPLRPLSITFHATNVIEGITESKRKLSNLGNQPLPCFWAVSSLVTTYDGTNVYELFPDFRHVRRHFTNDSYEYPA